VQVVCDGSLASGSCFLAAGGRGVHVSGQPLSIHSEVLGGASSASTGRLRSSKRCGRACFAGGRAARRSRKCWSSAEQFFA